MSLAASSLVGQHLGNGEESEADAYGAEIIRLALVIYLIVGTVVVLLSSSIAEIFVSGSEDIEATAVFVAIAAVSSVGLGLDGTSSGVLVGAGDTRWPFIGSLIGRYVFALPAALFGLVTPLGVVGLYLALILESFVSGIISYGLFRSGRWKAISQRYRPSSDIID